MASHYVRLDNPARLRRTSDALAASLTALATLAVGTVASAQPVCPAPQVVAGLRMPLGIAQSNVGNLLVAESGTSAPNTGRISIVELDGSRRTLIDGLPSGLNDVNDPSGPAGIAVRGRTVYVAIGVGDVGRPGPAPGTTVLNPNPVSSPLFSSILAIHFSAAIEKRTSGFTMSMTDQQALANGQTVTISSEDGGTLTIARVADFQNAVPNPLPFFPGNFQLSNPFDLVIVADRLYVTDGGRNLIWKVALSSGDHSPLATFPPVPNPVAPFGAPVIDAVPTGIAYSGDRLLVTLFRGFPFPPNTSVVEQVDPLTGAHAPIITGLKTAIDVVPVRERGETSYLVLQHVSGAPGPPALSGPGILFHVGTSAQTVANCFTRATSMALDEKTETVYILELGGRIVSVPFRQ
jgi:hypothetical protein